MLAKIIKPFTLSAACFAAVLSQSVLANPVQDFVNNLTTFEADFSQKTLEESMFGPVHKPKKGHFQLLRPGKLVWEYAAADGQRIVVDGKNLWVMDKDLYQATVRPIADVQADIPLSWLLYEEKIEDKFEIIFAGEREGLVWYNLEPKAATYFQSIEVGLKDGIMQQVLMYEGPENITQIEFSNVETNQSIAEETFRFELQPGVDLIGQPTY